MHETAVCHKSGENEMSKHFASVHESYLLEAP